MMHPIINSFKNGLKIFALKNNPFLPLLGMYGGVTWAVKFSALYLASLLVRGHLALTIVVVILGLDFLISLLMLGTQVEIIKGIGREESPSLNPFKLIFRKPTLEYFAASCLLGIIILGICLCLFVPLSLVGMAFSGWWKETVGDEAMGLITLGIGGLLGLLISSRMSYFLFKVGCDSQFRIRESFRITKGHGKNIFSITIFIVVIVLMLCWGIREALLIGSPIIRAFSGSLLRVAIDLVLFWSVSSLAFYFKTYVEGNQTSLAQAH